MESLNIPSKKKLKYFFEYIFLKPFLSAMALLPRESSLALGRKMGLVLYQVLHSRNEIARKNLTESFPQLSTKDIESTVRNCWEGLGESLSEFVQMPILERSQFDSLLEAEGLEQLQKSYQKNRGTLLVAAHYGLWELGNRILPERGFPTAVVARKIKNPYVNEWVTRIRCSYGTTLFLSRDGVRESIRWLKEGNILILLIDHRIQEGGLRIPFFGRLADTTSLPAILALRYRVPVHLSRCWKEGGKIKLQILPPLDLSDLDQNGDGIQVATGRMNRILENWIRERPETWLWIHNRWKI